RDSRRTKCVELLDQDVGIHDAELLSGEITHICQRAVRREVLLAIRPQRYAMNTTARERITKRLSKRTTANFLSLLVIVRQQERNVENGNDRVEAAEERRRGNRCLKRPKLDTFGHLALLAELALREDLEFHSAIGALRDESRNLFKVHMARLLCSLQVTNLRYEVCCPDGGNCRHTDDTCHCN